MNGIILEAGSPESCQPVTHTRPLDSFPVANVPLGELQALRLEGAGFEATTKPRRASLSLYLPADSWVSDESLGRLAAASRSSVLRDSGSKALAWISESVELPEAAAVLAADEGSFRIRFPWDLLEVNEIAVVKSLDAGPTEGPPPGVSIEGRIRLGAGTRFLPGVYVEGDVLVGRKLHRRPELLPARGAPRSATAAESARASKSRTRSFCPEPASVISATAGTRSSART